MAVTPASTEPADTLTDWLTLCHAPGAGTVTIQRLLENFSTPAAAFKASNGELLRLGLKQPTIDALRKPEERLITRELEWREADNNHIITCRDPAYPVLLAQLPDPPPLLYIHGDVSLLSEPQLAMVGSRNPSSSGRQTAVDFARHLASAGLVITSGLALGIDAACHQGALDANAPTIAIMGTGLDRVYPARHRDLARRIAEQGSLVSEFPLGTSPQPGNFPQRNRIISGLSLGTLVVEAAIRSGSLISARYALEQGREVFAIPGSIHNPLARGCHHLIREGAKLVETAQDVIDELGSLAAACSALPGFGEETARPQQLGEEYLQLLDSIDFDPTSVDQLVERSGLTPAEVSSMLLQLELNGHIASNPGGRYSRLKNIG
jgi:DNA processing protein